MCNTLDILNFVICVSVTTVLYTFSYPDFYKLKKERPFGRVTIKAFLIAVAYAVLSVGVISVLYGLLAAHTLLVISLMVVVLVCGYFATCYSISKLKD